MNAAAAQGQAISVIVHEVRARHRMQYERWMAEATAAHRRFPGYLAGDVIRPVGERLRYVAILRFASADAAQAWLGSSVRRELLDRAAPWLARPDRYQVHHDEEFWFNPQRGVGMPKRWKQWVLSTLAVFPLSTLLPWALVAALGPLAPALPAIVLKALGAGAISALMVYWLMPSLTRLAAPWLSR